MQRGAPSAELGEGVRYTEGLPPAGGALCDERGAGEAAVRLHGSEGECWTDEHGALAHPEQP